MEAIKTIIIDDEKLARDLLVNYLSNFKEIEIVKECENGFEGLKAINELDPHLIFLDIQMPKINGFEMLELLEKKPEIIFTTAYDQYAIKAFEHNAVGYLLKPFSKERFNKAIHSVFERINFKDKKQLPIDQLISEVQKPDEKLSRVVVKKGSEIHVLAVESIIYFEAQDDYVMIYTKDSRYLKQKTMKYYESNLEESQFVRTHRSFIVNIQQIAKLELYDKESYMIILKSGQKLKSSKSGYKKLKEVLRF